MLYYSKHEIYLRYAPITILKVIYNFYIECLPTLHSGKHGIYLRYTLKNPL